MLVWNGHHRGHLSGAEAATFVLLGISAAVGAVIYLLATVAVVAGARPIARLAAGLTWLRLAAVVVALVAITISAGMPAVVGPLPITGAVVAVADALLAVAATGQPPGVPRSPDDPTRGPAAMLEGTARDRDYTALRPELIRMHGFADESASACCFERTPSTIGNRGKSHLCPS